MLIDGSIHEQEDGHRRAVEACEGAMLFATTGILGYMVADGFQCAQKVKARHPDLKMVIGGWFASVKPELQLRTGLYDAVVMGQGEITFREVVQAIDAGEPLDGIDGLALLRDDKLVETPRRAVAGWDKVLKPAYHLIDIEPYKVHQLRQGSHKDVLRMPTPLSMGDRAPYFGITYFSSYGCPEPCTFCCSPEVTSRRWKAQPADRMLDELEELHDRWGFDVVRFHDANWGVMEKRSRDFAEGLLKRDMRIHWNCFIETHSILMYKSSTLDLMAESGMYVAEIGAEAATEDMMRAIGKPIKGDDNVEAGYEMDRRGIMTSITYIIGYPGESADSMLATLDMARRTHVLCPLSSPTVWPYRPIPGTSMFRQAVDLGYKPPVELVDWGSIGEYHLQETWPGNIPEEVARVRKAYDHFRTLDRGLARGTKGFWEKRARRRLETGDYSNSSWEMRAFDVYNRVERKFLKRGHGLSRSFMDPGHKTGSGGNSASGSRDTMTSATSG